MQVPRAEMDAGTPSDVTFAPRVAPVAVIEETVGVVTTGLVLAGATVTVVHAPQLFASSDSVMTPPPAEEVLSTQTRTEYEPAEGNAYVGAEAIRLAPISSVAIPVDVRSVMVPPPLIAVAT